MQALGWPFLIARGRHTDYRTVSAPDFLVQADAYGVLSDSVRRADMRDGDVRAVAIDSPVGELTATYTSERLEGSDPGGERWPTDEHGRPLQVLYGIVTRGSPNGAVDALDLGEARREALAGFRRFLASEASFTVDTTPGFELRRVAPRTPAPAPLSPPPLPPPPDRRPSRSPARLWVAAGAAALVLVAVSLWALQRDRPQPLPPVIVTAEIRPQPDPATCTELMALIATITVDRATKVRYHWESPPGRRVAPRRPLTFVTGERARQVHRNVDPSAGDAAVHRISYALVIDAPAPRRTLATYRLTCGAAPVPAPPAPAAPAAGQPPQPAPPAAVGSK